MFRKKNNKSKQEKNMNDKRGWLYVFLGVFIHGVLLTMQVYAYIMAEQ